MDSNRTRQRRETTEPTGITELVAADVMLAAPQCLVTLSLQGVAALMREENCDTIALVDHERRPVGVISGGDVAVRCFRDGRDDAMGQSASDCMSTPIVAVFLDTSVADCSETMATNQLRSVPVIDRDGHLRGVVREARA